MATIIFVFKYGSEGMFLQIYAIFTGVEFGIPLGPPVYGPFPATVKSATK